MRIFPFLCSLLSIASGLVGYKMAITQDPQGIKEYISAVTLGFFFQIFISAIVSNRKDKLIEDSLRLDKGSNRVNLVILLSWIIAGIAGLSILLETFPDQLLLYAGLIFMGFAFQYATFEVSSRQFIRNPDKFWKFQLSGAFFRAIGTLVLVVYLETNYLGILISNLIASLAICYHYKTWPLVSLNDYNQLRFSFNTKKVSKVITLDGFIRAGKGLFESTAISLCALLGDSLGVIPAKFVQPSYMAVGYLNTMNNVLRQTFSRWELVQNTQSKKSLKLYFLLSIAIAIVGVVLNEKWHLFDLFLPGVSQDSLDFIVVSSAIVFAMYPLTQGFLYADYFSPDDLKRFGLRLILSFLLFLSLALILIWNTVGVLTPIIFLPVPISILISIKGLHVRTH
jgi:hypothetical protein